MLNRLVLTVPLLLAAVLPAAAQTPPQISPPNPYEQNIIDQFNALETQARNAARPSGEAARAAMAYKALAEQLQARVTELEKLCGKACEKPAPQAEVKPEVKPEQPASPAAQP